MKLVVWKNNLGGHILYRSADHVKQRRLCGNLNKPRKIGQTIGPFSIGIIRNWKKILSYLGTYSAAEIIVIQLRYRYFIIPEIFCLLYCFSVWIRCRWKMIDCVFFLKIIKMRILLLRFLNTSPAWTSSSINRFL